jgi:ATP-binding cassette subfamily F protein uup
VNRSPQARTTKAKSRVDAYFELKDKVGKTKVEAELQMDLKGQRLGKKVLELHHVSKAFDQKVILDGFSYKFKPMERVGIVGPNGVGKTTFINLITAAMRPDSGKVVVGENTVFGYYTQDGIQLLEDKRVLDVIQDIAEYIPLEKGLKLSASQLLERFLFSRKQQQVYVSQLSGGEKRRLYLLSVLMKNPNFLILDEPTNDLDILTLNVLEDFLMEFPGCVVIVSHDRYFMDKLVDHLFVLEGQGKCIDFNGDYSEYRLAAKSKMQASKKEEKAVAREMKESVPKASVVSFEQRKEINRVEKEILKLEEKKKQVTDAFDDPNLTPEKIQTLSKELKDLSGLIEEKELRWLELND